jgi:molybdate transport system substrate-binding protein
MLRIMRMLGRTALAVLLSATAATAAGDVRVMTSGAFSAAHAKLSPQFERTAKTKVVTVVNSTGVGADSIPSRLKRGEAADVIILPEAALDDLIKDGLVAAASKTMLARSAIGMGVRAGAPKPDISTVDALKRTLLNAKSVAYSASVSGLYLTNELFPRLGIVEQMKAKGRRIEVGRVGEVVAKGEVEIGFQQISELMEVRGVDLVGPLPAEVQRVTVVVAGIAAASNNPEAARALIRFFASPEAVPGIREVGLEPIVKR